MNSVLSPDFRIPGDLLTFVNVNSNTINVRIVFLYKKAVVWSKTRSWERTCDSSSDRERFTVLEFC